MVILLKETDGTTVGKEWQGESGAGVVIAKPGALGTIVSFTKTITTAGTPERLTATSTPCKKVWVGVPTSSGIIAFVGDSAVSAVSGSERGVELIPGNAFQAVEIDNLRNLYGDVQTSGGRICGCYLV